MITRLEIDGFKNLVGVDLRFGPFTCIAGANGVGKSNLFDAIRFLSNLASQKSLMEAAALVRDSQRAGDVRSIFRKSGNRTETVMKFGMEMIVPPVVVDDLGQEAKASITFLRYELELALIENGAAGGSHIEILNEALSHINLGDAPHRLKFDHSAGSWRDSVITGARRNAPFISTTTSEPGKLVVQRHQDGGSSGKPVPVLAKNLKRTVLSSGAADTPTILCARREMESWQQLQLEPSALREPSAFNAPKVLEANGKGLPAALDRISRSGGDSKAICSSIANRLSELIRDVRDLDIDRNEKLELLTLMLTDREGTTHPARALSDGTLRFIALAVLEKDPEAKGVLCLEEPENGIHPDRIHAIMELLQDIAVDPHEEVGPDNPLRQVIINTHSPLVVGECPDDALIFAKAIQGFSAGSAFNKVIYRGLTGTWRCSPDEPGCSRGDLLSYLSPASLRQTEFAGIANRSSPSKKTKLKDRSDLQPELPYPMVSEP